MAGGILQISTYGSQDLFLTGTPEITYFKVVYRRYTTFSMESVAVNFVDPVGFGRTTTLIVPRVGDLIHKTYLQVTLPVINLFRNTLPDPTNAQISYNAGVDNYQTTTAFMSINRSAYVMAFNLSLAENNSTTTTGDMIAAINKVFNTTANLQIANNFSVLLTQSAQAPFLYSEVSMQSIANNFSAGSSSNDLLSALSVGIDKSIKTQNFFFQRMQTRLVTLNNTISPNIEFAWVNRIGHAIINQIEVQIGGQKIDRHYGDWINIWYELTANRNMQQAYFNMIGNVSQLTSFNRAVKPSYILKIPLQFWFCRYNGLSIPLVSLEYHDVGIKVQFRRIEEVSYIENNTILYSKAPNGLTLNEVPEQLNVDIDAQLLIDYIYLDSPERRRFAQSSHEYLIEELQRLETTNVTQQTVQFVLNNFVHPSKELIWVAQQQSFTENVTGMNQCMWDNYSISTINAGNAIIFSHMDFHSYTRVPRLDGNYFNYVQPYEAHRTTPSDGINMYSFSLFPEEQQPSGSANLSRLTRVVLYLEFDQTVLFTSTVTTPLVVRIYTRNINILRFVSGLSGLAFNYG